MRARRPRDHTRHRLTAQQRALYAPRVEDCLACELADGRRELPGGRVAETRSWLVEHCVGPLGAGTMIVKPRRHVLHVSELDEEEAVELGPLLQRVSAAIAHEFDPEQVYVTLWSHSGGVPVHIHWVLQPVGAGRLGGLLGPHLQAAMFERDEAPARAEIEAAAAAIRGALAA